jgi:parallel beta-helix repeat protein
MIGRAVRRASLLALVAGGVALAAPSVAAANPTCGSKVMHNVKLTGNMSCSGDALDVGKSGITIDLNGHTISGPGIGSTHYGVYISKHNNVTVENGTVASYYYGVLDQYTSGAKILHVKAMNDEYGLNIWYSVNGLIADSTATKSYDGVYLYENWYVTVDKTKAGNNSDYGVYDYYSHATLERVTANSNGSYGFYIDYPSAAGSKASTYYTILNSTADNNGYAGFYVYDNYGGQWPGANLIGNTANNDTTYGFYAEYRGSKGKGNHATGNSTNCDRVPCG